MFGSINKKNILCVGLLLISTCSLFVSAQREVFVNCNLGTPGTNTGTGSLADPFNNLQAAVTALGPGGGIITTTAGVCRGPLNRGILISHTNLLIRTLPIGGLTTIDCETHHIRAFIVDNGQLNLQRFGIQRCGDPNMDGGGLYIKNSYVVLNSTVVIQNVALHGAGFFAEDASILLASVNPTTLGAISINQATQPNGGGGIFIRRTSVTDNGFFISANGPDDIHCESGSVTGSFPFITPATKTSCQSCYVQGIAGANACPAA